MFLRKRNIIIALILVFGRISFSQCVINNGAQIVFSGGGQVYIAGASKGDYLSQNGGVIKPSAAGIITMEGDWTNNSANTGFNLDAGTVIFNGSTQSINGTNSTTFYNLTLQGNGTKTQNLNTFVGGVSTTNGVLSVGAQPYDLNSFTLTVTNPAAGGITFSSGYIISEVNLAYNPSVLRWNMGTSTGAHIYPFGTVTGIQIPFTFNKTSAGAADISISTRSTAASNNLPWSSPVTNMFSPIINGDGSIPVVIDRWWDIFGTGVATADATFSYLGLENTLTPPYNTGNLGAQNWTGFWNPPIGSNAAVLAGVGTAFASGIPVAANTPGSSPWILSSLSAPLPVTLTHFAAICSGSDEIKLEWSTASEKNASTFEIQNSLDGVVFNKVANVAANGNTEAHQYSFVVKNRSQYGKYFRLKMIDKDFTSSLSPVSFIGDNCEATGEAPVIYYSEETGIVVTCQAKENCEYSMSLFDGAGRLVETNILQFSKGYNRTVIDAKINSGIYLVNLTGSGNSSVSKKILKLD